jgi:hypothetical protein
MAARSGGGINSRVVSQVKAGKSEPKPHSVSMGAVSRLGAVIGEGTPLKPLYKGAGYSTPQGPTDNTANLGPGGCGRMVMRAGSQSATPAPKPMSPSTRKF